MVLQKSPKIPGQLIGEPGPPLNTTQIRALLEQLYKLADRPPVQMSGRRGQLDITDTDSATHVYVKVDNPGNLAPKFEGPYEIIDRPSRSTVRIKVGTFKSGEVRDLTYHWSSCKVAHLREGQQSAERPKLGRPKMSHTNTLGDKNSLVASEIEDSAGAQNESSQQPPLVPDNNKREGAKIQTTLSTKHGPPSLPAFNNPLANDHTESERFRPVRKTRNANPRYID